ncbi:helix-hairpin-helix domain-containing protein [Capnocytophaga sp. Marseille-Q4570]|uniref:Helix-hairpin-helix domain-containing protein n=1 Tax=Capnocytophaga bilenii TaxID=2819369 RepID=A0ABS3PVR8_9FLAO|nr:helix-hairpin-helix domain-containing protein [Capnocytophaga bilenii]MBO1883421.1 helix-hairpin-helix domain-containing protein [Capnocytophaga bilenii]
MSFSHQQLRGIWIVCVLITAAEVLLYYYNQQKRDFNNHIVTSLDSEIDSLRSLASHHKHDTIYPFNPNFLTDYKAFRIGLTPAQYDRLQAFRAQDKYLNSAKEFQQITKVSDSVLARISPAFKFPSWASQAKKTHEQPKLPPKEDINTATAETLMKIYGIGEAFAKRILQYREKLGGFTYIEQVAEVYHLEKEVYERVAERFEVKTAPVIEKKDINQLNMYQLSKIPYINYGEGKKIVALRSSLGKIQKIEDLQQIEGFSPQRIQRLQLYLYAD